MWGPAVLTVDTEKKGGAHGGDDEGHACRCDDRIHARWGTPFLSQLSRFVAVSCQGSDTV